MSYLFPYAGDDRRRAKLKPKKPAPLQHPRRVLPQAPVPEHVISFQGVANMPLPLRQIMLEVCKEHNVVPIDIVGTDSRKHVVQARRVYCIRAKEETNCSYSKIARSINKDHTTVIYFVKQGLAGCSLEPMKVTHVPTPRKLKGPVVDLTALEQQYFDLSQEGLTDKEIAQRMDKSYEAVRHYPKRIKRKMALALTLKEKDDGLLSGAEN